MTGNKGEWSEFYAFLKLMDDRVLRKGDPNHRHVAGPGYPILNIVREEGESTTLRYDLTVEDADVGISGSGVDRPQFVNLENLKDGVKKIFQEIKEASSTTFTVESASEFMRLLNISSLTAGSRKKADLVITFHDPRTGTEPEAGFSIKSQIGNPPTLLNASRATNFVYRVDGLDVSEVARINEIDGRSKIRDRLGAVGEAGGSLNFKRVFNEVFRRNLVQIDSLMPEIMAAAVLAYFRGIGPSVKDIVEYLAEEDSEILHLKLDRAAFEHKFKNLLQHVALGLVPANRWDGNMRAHGGYIVVREDGELVSYHVYNLDLFRSYLFENTKLESAGSTRHDYGSLYRKDGEIYINLNLQIRFTS